jgi:organic hydroperoxide reductase OsmC/OhrA
MNDRLPYFYETEVTWTGERRGDLRAPGLPALEVAAPPEFKGHEGIWSPELLYVASVNSCFMATFLAIAELSKLGFIRFTCNARGKLEKEEGRGYRITEIVLSPKLVIGHERDAEQAIRILEKAEKSCLISNSINTAVRLEPEVVFDDLAKRAV